MAAVGTAGAATFTVTSADDGNDEVCAPAPGHCSLREAIGAANADNNLDTIAFAVGVGLVTIQPLSPLPTVTNPVILDGHTQTGWDDGSPPLVELDGSAAGSAHGLALSTSNAIVRGFVINGFTQFTRGGIYIANGARNNLVVGNWIGTNAAGTAADANWRGILVDGQDNIVGLTADPDDRNVISGNTFDGVEFGPTPPVAATGNVVQGNYLGTNTLGTAAVPNGFSGVSDNGVGTQTIHQNVISGNTGAGINAFSNTTITGNRVGTNAAGTAAVPNATGISIRAANTSVGGTPAERNVISGNTGAGIRVLNAAASNVTIRSNYIGVDVTGTVDLGNGVGIELSQSSVGTVVGGETSAEGNLISGNATGILVSTGSTGNTVTRNQIGPSSTGAGLGNSTGVMVLDTATATIGVGNEIAYNSGVGVDVETTTGRATVDRNGIHTNGGLGIDLGPNGVTANDGGDADAGANNLQNFPVISSVQNGTITGTLSSAASATYEVDFFQSAACDPSGNGEGAAYLGSRVVSTGPDGNGPFTASLPLIGVGQWVTATATDEAGNTSEFSSCALASASETFTVNSTSHPGVGGCDIEQCTLNEAITAANATPAHDTIAFAIPGSGVRTIFVPSALPTITQPVTIDGYTQPGASPNTLAAGNDATLLIELNGTGGGYDGLRVTGGGATVRGLVINNFNGDAIELNGAGGNTIAGNFVGTNPTGVAPMPSRSGIYMEGTTDNVIGGTAPADRNVLVATQFYPIWTQTPDAAGGRAVIQGNYIGSNAQGTAVLGLSGIVLSNADNLIGGTAPGAGNVIANQGRPGIHLDEGGAHHNTIQGNHIGVTADGTAILGNLTGIQIERAADNLVGGSTAAARNVIAAPSGVVTIFGVSGSAAGNRVEGNYLGTNAAGTAILPSGGGAGAGVMIDSSSLNVVAGNLISGQHTGVRILSQAPAANGNRVERNRIGTNAAGTAALPNGIGVAVGSTGGAPTPSADNVVGGSGAGNVISGNTGDGVQIFGADATTIQENLVGVAADGTSALGNGGNGINISSGVGNVVGGTAVGSGNVIAHNGSGGADGVAVTGGTRNAIRHNSIHSNAGLGIDLTQNGVTQNDVGDGDVGPNELQNFPVLAAATVDGASVHVTGVLDTRPSEHLFVDVYKSAACDGSGNGEGAAWIGSIETSSDASGHVEIDSSFVGGGVVAGDAVTATATLDDDGSSEFSACIEAAGRQTFTVNTTGVSDDGACTALGDLGADCTLPEAIDAANADAATADTIAFAIPGPGVKTIDVNPAPLPAITAPVTIDGTTQGVPGHLIEVSGNLETTPNGFEVNASGVTIRGLVVNSFVEAGILLQQGGNTVEGNWLGLNELGAGAGSGQDFGVALGVESDTNTIRGNAIGGNVIAGIEVATNRIDSADGNTIAGNLIGTDAAGASPAANGTGIILAGAFNTVGGPEPADLNVISGNSDDGVLIMDGSENAVTGNHVGLNSLGSRTIGNGGNGIAVSGGDDAEIGGTSLADRNLISANGAYGVSVGGTSVDTAIRGNVVGAAAENPNCVITQPASIAGETATAITFVNSSGTTVQIFWLDYEGERVLYNTLTPGQSYLQETWLTHPWVAIDPEGDCIGYTVSDVASKTYVIEPPPEPANAAGGIFVNGAPDTRIGGSSAGAGNVVSGNAGHGIHVVGEGATRTVVEGNFIGTDATGTQDVGNAREGVRVETGPARIGGAGEGDDTRNVISGNDGFGVLVYGASQVTVQSNYVGVDVTGSNALGNGWDGIGVDGGGSNLIGGTALGAGNVVGANANQGVAVFGVDFYEGTDDNVVQGNRIGVGADGETPLGNGGDGIRLANARNTMVGGTDAGAGNVVRFNDVGIAVHGAGSTQNTVSGNTISDSVDTGVVVDGATDNTIGPANTIHDNGQAATGVHVTGVRNRVTQNSIDSNQGLGIDVGAVGVTVNDVEDQYQDFPLLDTATFSDSLAVSGEVPNVAEAATYHLEFFRSDSCDGSGHGEGATFLGSLDVAASGEGVDIPFTWVLEAEVPLGDVVTATATDADGSTSEFSACEEIVAGGEPPTASVTLTATTSLEEAGAARVQLEDVPFAAILEGARRTNTNAAPVNELPVNELPVNELPVNELPVNELGFLQLPDLLRAVPLSSIPLLRPGGWQTFLSTTDLKDVPLTNVTLRDVLLLSPLPPGLDPAAPNDLRLSEIDFSRSPLGRLSATVLVLGDETKLAELPIPGGDAAWCQIFSGPPINCSSAGQVSGSSLLELSLRGAPVNELPVNELPVNELPVNELPVNELPVNELNVAASPVNELPVNELPVNELPVNELPVNELLARGSPVNELPVNELTNLNAILDCEAHPDACLPGKTLGEVANALRLGVTFGDIRVDLLRFDPDFTFGDLRYYGQITLGQLLAAIDAMSPPADPPITLGDVYALLFTPNAVRWERLDLEATQITQFATDGSIVDYQAAFELTPDGPAVGTSAVEISVELPAGFLYVPGSSKLVRIDSPGDTAPLPDPSIAGQRLTWTTSALMSVDYRIDFQARPGLVVGPVAASASATPQGGEVAASGLANLEVGETFEPNTLAAPQQISDDSFYLSHITSRDDIDYYSIVVPTAGARTTVRLSHVPAGADFDLVVYGPDRQPLRPAVPGTPPLDTPPLTDEGAQLTHRTDTLGPQVLADVPLADKPVVGVSVNRGQEEETVIVLSSGSGGAYTIQVSGYNGTTSPRPYMLRVSTEPPRIQPSCAPRAFPNGAGGPGSLPSILPAALNTVFVVNEQQLERLYGTDGRATVMGALSSNVQAMADLGFPSAILAVDGSQAVRDLYDSWNACPSDPILANAVVRGIGGLLDGIRQTRPTLKYVVLVGGDDVVPHGRLGDFASVANEFGYADTFPIGSALFGSAYNSQILSDDVYADVDPVPYLDRQLHLPDLVPGRLVETPQQIADAVTRFIGNSGRLNPQTALTTGYDFIKDGAAAVDTILTNKYGAANSARLIDDGWTRGQLLSLLFPADAPSPGIASLNGHADHNQLLPAAGNTTGDNSDNFTTANLPVNTALLNRTVFSIGCHFGLSVNDVLIAANSDDWAQALAARGAQLLGNTGFGYGDTNVVAYSEELSRRFAQNIVSGAMSAGEAVVNAKQEYFAGSGVFSVYDEKAMAELTLYGMPMAAVGPPGATPAQPTGAAAAPPVIDGATGLAAAPFSVDPPDTPPISTPRGSYFQGPDGVQVSHWRPIQPKQFVSLAGTDHHGVLLTELTSRDVGIEPVYARPSFDLSSNEPEAPFADVVYPTKLDALRTYKPSFGVVSQRLVLVTGQFFSDETPDAAAAGTQRLFTHIAGRVFKSSSADFNGPEFQRVDAQRVGGTLAVTVDVTDRGATPESAGTVKLVTAAVLDGTDAVWKFFTLAETAPGRFTGGIAISSQNAALLVQAVDAAGNVRSTWNKGRLYEAADSPVGDTGGLGVTPNVSPGPSGWYTGAVTLAVQKPAGVLVDVSVDGSPFQPAGDSVTVSADGVHTVVLRGSNGGTASETVPIDATAPRIEIGTPAAGAEYAIGSRVFADYRCSDSGSGITGACTGTVANGAPINIATLGPKTFTVNGVSDAAGNSTPARTVSYTVVERRIVFASSRTGNGDIYSMNPDGTGVTRLTATSWIEAEPVLSPDGSEIAFTSTRDQNLELYVMNADGSGVTRLTNAPGIDTSASWSPNGLKLAFSSQRTGGETADIFVMNADGTGQTRLTADPKDDLLPAWSPNGEKIAFTAYRSGKSDIYVMNATGGAATRLTNHPEFEHESAWSPDGSKIAFSSNRPGSQNFEIYVMNANGSGVTRLTTNAALDAQPVWSRSGAKIAFTSTRDRNVEIYSINANGSSPTRLTIDPALDAFPDW